MKSWLDSNTWKQGIRKALQIKGDQDAPNHVNVDQIQFIIDSLQSGFSHYSLHAYNTTLALSGGVSSANTTLFEPFSNILALTDVRNNFDWETRLLGLECRFENIGASSGDEIWIELSLQFQDPIIGLTTIRWMRMEQPQIGGVTAYRFMFPSLTNVKDKVQGTRDNFAIPQNSWNSTGWLPARTRLFLTAGREGGNFGADDVVQINMLWARTPKGTMPPK